ncbi:hypothetical protein Hanom_Chr04g00353411 [Helianthus anomalus]
MCSFFWENLLIRFVFAFWIGIESQFFVLRQQFQTLAKIIGDISVSFVPKIENIQQGFYSPFMCCSIGFFFL